MKVIVSAILLVVIVALADARVDDTSTKHETPEQCESWLRLKIQGNGRAADVDEARKECAKSCDDDVDTFKDEICPWLCGKDKVVKKNVSYFMPPLETCNLCHPKKSPLIKRCRNVTDKQVKRCKRECYDPDNDADEDPTTYDYIVRATSGKATLKFPGKVTK